MKRRLWVMVLAVLLCCGCGGKEEQEELRRLDYTIVREEELPPELKKLLDEKKQLPFRLTYEDDELLYIAAGYGERSGGGYSIQIRDMGLGSNAVYFRTELIGPKKEERLEGAKSYPYIVIKTGKQKCPVVFQ